MKVTEKHILGVREYWEVEVFKAQFWGFVGGAVVGVLITLIWA